MDSLEVRILLVGFMGAQSADLGIVLRFVARILWRDLRPRLFPSLRRGLFISLGVVDRRVGSLVGFHSALSG